MQVRDRHDDDSARSFSEQDAKRKCLGEAPADIKFDDGIQMGIEQNSVDRVLYRRQEPPAKVTLLRFVVRGGPDHFRFRIGMEFDGVHARES